MAKCFGGDIAQYLEWELRNLVQGHSDCQRRWWGDHTLRTKRLCEGVAPDQVPQHHPQKFKEHGKLRPRHRVCGQ